MPQTTRHSVWSRYAYGWVTLAFFLFSLAGHWLFGWFAYAGEQAAHGQAPQTGEYVVQMMRDTLENWQSEFLQLLWQVGGLAVLFYVGSPQSREGEERKEAKLDAILRKVDPQDGERVIKALDTRYDR